MKTMLLKSSVLLLSSLSFASPLMAYQSGDWILRLGSATVDPASKSEDVDQITGAQVSADTNTQLGISGTYILTDQWGIEVLAASPFSHDLEGKGGLNGADIGSIKHLPPTLSAQYFFMSAENPWQPYIGLGLNYTTFFSEETGGDVETLGYSKLSLDDSLGLAASAGVDYRFDDHWGINASVMYAQIHTTATLSGNGVNDLTVDYDLDPMVYRLSAVYKF